MSTKKSGCPACLFFKRTCFACHQRAIEAAKDRVVDWAIEAVVTGKGTAGLAKAVAELEKLTQVRA